MRAKPKPTDRRANRRYDVTLDVRWTMIYRQVLYSGSGLTRNMSSGGILFETDDPPAVGRRIEMSIAWPALLDEAISLRLIIEGRVLRASGQLVAVGVERYQFRTGGQRGYDALRRDAQ